jgi:phosphoribosylanthranilate isomerase
MVKPFVKICGITNRDDALWAAKCGAKAIGLIFALESPRNIGLEVARDTVSDLPDSVWRVGVFVNASVEFVNRCIRELGLTCAQLHGEELPDYCEKVRGKVIKAFRVSTESDLRPLNSYDVDAFLLDAFISGKRGGTGKTFDWSLTARAKEYGVPIILSGGLNPENVIEAIETVQPAGVDASSGVEISPGRKDREKVRLFVERATRAFGGLRAMGRPEEAEK